MSTSPDLSEKRAKLLEFHNDARTSRGLSKLKMSSGANEAALYHAKDMADEGYFSHNSQDPFEYWYKRINRFVLYQVGGENIGKGYDWPYQVFNAWMNSPGHKQNILTPNFVWVGFGYAQSSYGKLWVADFVYGSGSGY